MAYLGYRTESDVLATQRHIKELVRASISRQPGEPKFFVDGRVFNACWPKIWQWLNVQSLGTYLLKYDIIKDPTELFSLNNNYFSPRQKADSLLSLVHQGGQYGYHMLYLCILEDDENPLGHADAAQMLMDYARKTRTVPPPSLMGEDPVPTHSSHDELSVEHDGPSAQGYRERASSSPSWQYRYRSPVAGFSPPNSLPNGEREMLFADDFHYSGQENGRTYSSLPRHVEHSVAQGTSPESHRWSEQRQHLLSHYSPAELTSDGRGSTSTTRSSFPYDSAHSESHPLESNGLLISGGGAYFEGSDTEMDGPVSAPSRPWVIVNGADSPPPPRHHHQPHPDHNEPGSTGSEGEAAGQPLPHGVSTISKEDIMSTAQDMVDTGHLSDHRLPQGCALEILGNDDFDTKDDIMDETIKFLVSCLNSRAEGVSCGLLVAGADYQETVPQQARLGLAISRNDLRGLQMRFYELLRRRIFVRTADSRIEPAHSLESLTRLEVISVEAELDSATRTPEVVVVSVVPEMAICKDLLYLYNTSDSRRRHVYKRTEDGPVKVSSQKSAQLQQNLIRHYNRWRQ